MSTKIKCKKNQMKSAARAAIELAIYLIFRTISAFAVGVCARRRRRGRQRQKLDTDTDTRTSYG